MTTPEHAPPEALRAAADAFDDACVRKLDVGQTTALIADAVWRQAVAEGRRQATEGWERRYGVRMEWLDGPSVGDCDDRETAEDYLATLPPSQRGIASLVSRLVGPWGPAEVTP